MGEALRFERGELSLRVTRRELKSGREVSAGFGGQRITRLRERLNLSQPVFAQVLNVSAETVKKWEQDKRTPEGSALRLLELTEQHPEWVIERLEKAFGNGKR